MKFCLPCNMIYCKIGVFSIKLTLSNYNYQLLGSAFAPIVLCGECGEKTEAGKLLVPPDNLFYFVLCVAFFMASLTAWSTDS